MTEPIRTINLTVGYRSRHSRTVVLDGLNLAVRGGELVCLLGTNGTGKSTLLRTLARIQPPLSGSLEIEGRDLQQLTPLQLARRLGIVLTERPLVGALTARRLVELGRYPYWDWSGRMSARDHEVVQWAIESVGAEQLASRDCTSLSDGERQRFMIARALAQEPSILLLDEPTAFLDVPARVEVMGLLRRLAREEELAIVVSTHDLELALRMADTIWLVSAEKRVHVGTPEDLILAGNIEEAFQAESIQFHPEERAFRLVTEVRGQAIVIGDGLHAVLAAAVLERERYAVVSHGPDAIRVTASEDASWEIEIEGSHHAGTGFASLAQFLRDGIPNVRDVIR